MSCVYILVSLAFHCVFDSLFPFHSDLVTIWLKYSLLDWHWGDCPFCVPVVVSYGFLLSEGNYNLWICLPVRENEQPVASALAVSSASCRFCGAK